MFPAFELATQHSLSKIRFEEIAVIRAATKVNCAEA